MKKCKRVGEMQSVSVGGSDAIAMACIHEALPVNSTTMPFPNKKNNFLTVTTHAVTCLSNPSSTPR